jgi:hypothetical protein
VKLLKDKGTLGIILGIFVAVGVSIFLEVGWEKLLPLLAVVIIALVFISLAANAEDRFTRELDKRLPQISYLNSRKDVELTTLELVERSNEFIVGTGGRSRNQDYLKAIERRVCEGKVLYWRILYEEEITHELCEHLCRLISLPNVTIAQVKDTAYGNMTITDNGFVMALPVPGHVEMKGISIPSKDHAHSIYNSYMMIVFSKAKKIDTDDDVRSLCEPNKGEKNQRASQSDC